MQTLIGSGRWPNTNPNVYIVSLICLSYVDTQQLQQTTDSPSSDIVGVAKTHSDNTSKNVDIDVVMFSYKSATSHNFQGDTFPVVTHFLMFTFQVSRRCSLCQYVSKDVPLLIPRYNSSKLFVAFRSEASEHEWSLNGGYRWWLDLYTEPVAAKLRECVTAWVIHTKPLKQDPALYDYIWNATNRERPDNGCLRSDSASWCSRDVISHNITSGSTWMRKYADANTNKDI